MRRFIAVLGLTVSSFQ